jgi:hypothetical protein
MIPFEIKAESKSSDYYFSPSRIVIKMISIRQVKRIFFLFYYFLMKRNWHNIRNKYMINPE